MEKKDEKPGLATRHTEHKKPAEFKGFPSAVPKFENEQEDKLFLLPQSRKVEELTAGDENIALANVIIAARIREMAVWKRPDYPLQGI